MEAWLILNKEINFAMKEELFKVFKLSPALTSLGLVSNTQNDTR